MLQEERVTGGVSNKVYLSYIKASGGWTTILVGFFIAVLAQATRVGGDLWLVYWTNSSLNLPKAAYSGIYFAWGVAQGVGSSLLGAFLSLTFAAGSSIYHRDALIGIFATPIKFFDTTPLGRIVNRCMLYMYSFYLRGTCSFTRLGHHGQLATGEYPAFHHRVKLTDCLAGPYGVCCTIHIVGIRPAVGGVPNAATIVPVHEPRD